MVARRIGVGLVLSGLGLQCLWMAGVKLGALGLPLTALGLILLARAHGRHWIWSAWALLPLMGPLAALVFLRLPSGDELLHYPVDRKLTLPSLVAGGLFWVVFLGVAAAPFLWCVRSGFIGAWVMSSWLWPLSAIVLGHAALSVRWIQREEPSGDRKPLWRPIAALLFGYGCLAFLVLSPWTSGFFDYRQKLLLRNELGAFHRAETLYQERYPEVGYSPSLHDLGPPPKGQRPSPHHADLLPEALAQGFSCHRTSWHRFNYTPRRDADGKVVGYTFRAFLVWPYGETMSVLYRMDERGVIHK